MYVDDLLLSIRSQLSILWPDPFDNLLTDWDRTFLTSVGDHVAAGKSLSTNQAAVIGKLIGRLRHPLIRHGMATDDDLDRMLLEPEYRQALYPSLNIPREVRYLGDNILGFRFKPNDMLVASIREFGMPEMTDGFNYKVDLQTRPSFNWEYRIWLVPVLRHNVTAIRAFILEYHFAPDQPTLNYLRLASNSREQSSAFAIIDDVILANVCDHPLLAGWITEVADGGVL